MTSTGFILLFIMYAYVPTLYSIMACVFRTMSLHLFLALITSKFNYIRCTHFKCVCVAILVFVCKMLCLVRKKIHESLFNKVLSSTAST